MTEDLVSPKRLAFIYLYCNMKCFQMFPIYQSLSLKQTIRHLLQRQQQWLILANFGCQAGLQLPTAHQDDASHLGCNLPLPWLIFSPFLYFSALETFSSRSILCVHSKCFIGSVFLCVLWNAFGHRHLVGVLSKCFWPCIVQKISFSHFLCKISIAATFCIFDKLNWNEATTKIMSQKWRKAAIFITTGSQDVPRCHKRSNSRLDQGAILLDQQWLHTILLPLHQFQRHWKGCLWSPHQ